MALWTWSDHNILVVETEECSLIGTFINFY
jgi:hypothetical protein